MSDFNFLSVLNVIKYLTVTLVMGCILVMYKTIMGNNFVSYLFLNQSLISFLSLIYYKMYINFFRHYLIFYVLIVNII